MMEKAAETAEANAAAAGKATPSQKAWRDRQSRSETLTVQLPTPQIARTGA